MRYVHLVLILTLNVSAHAADAPAPARCDAHLSDDHLVEVTEQVITEIIVEQHKVIDLGFITGLVMPKGYAETEAEFRAAREFALTKIIPQLERLRREMDQNLPFEVRLLHLAQRYDEAQSKELKAVLFAEIMKMFSIPVEHHYINLIASGACSAGFKVRLGAALRKLFQSDQTWIRPLDQAMNRAGLR